VRPEDVVAGLEADLVALAAAEADLERDAEVAERTRIERSSITLVDRLRGARGPVELSTLGGGRRSGRVAEVGDGCVLLAHAPAGQPARVVEHLVVLGSVVAVRGLGRGVEPAGRLRPRSTASVLRGWCRDRAVVSVLRTDGETVGGLASAAYADHLELSTGGGATVLVPFAAMAAVSR
jgi:hypothetical protein